MAKKKAVPKKQKFMEETLWASANKLRGMVAHKYDFPYPDDKE